MKIPRTLLRHLPALLLAGLSPLSAQTTQIWGTGTGTWDTVTANWSGAVWTNGNNATFGTTTARTGIVTIDAGGVTVANVVSGSGAGAIYDHTLQGGSITLLGAASTWTIAGPAGSQLVVNSDIGGASSLEKLGTRLLILAGNNTYTGGTTITAGQLQIGNGGTTGSVTGNIVANSTLIFNRSDTFTFGGVISGTSAITHAGTGTLVLTGENVTTAALTVSGGTLQIGAGGTAGSYAGSIVNNGAVVFNRSNALTYSRTISGTGTVTKLGGDTLTLTSANTYTGATNVTAGTLAINGLQPLATGAISVASGATLAGIGTTGGTATIANGGTLLGQATKVFTLGGLVLNDTSNLNVSFGAASTTGLFNITGNLTLDGILNVTDAGGFGPGLYRLFDYTGTLTDNGLVIGTAPSGTAASLAIQTSTANQVNLFFDAGAPNLWRGGSGTWNADAAGSGWTDAVGTVNAPWTTPLFAVFSGTPGTVTIDTAAGAVAATGVQFAVDGYTLAGGTLTDNTPAAIFRVGNGTVAGAAFTATISAPIAGTGGLTKTDRGTLVLTGANSYAGATAVSTGTLRIDGNQSAATGAVSVASGATLGGSGTTGGVVTVAGGGTLLGQAGQVFTTAGLVLSNTTNLNVSFGAPSASALFQVNGNLTLDGILNLTDAGGFGPGVYRLMNYTGALTDHTLVFGTAPVSTQFLGVQTSVANQVNIVFDAGPRNFWHGGAGIWTADTASTAWTEFTGNAATFWTPQFAIFQNAPGTVTIDTAAGPVVATGAQFAANGFTLTGGALTNNTAAAIFRVGDGSAAGAAMSATIAAPIAGTGGLDKTDLGTLVLSGANTYAGATTVTGGTLRINGDQSAATGTTTVRTGATLAGSGTLGGAVTVENGGKLAGQSGQVLTTGALTLNPTAIVNVTFGAPSANALFHVTGDLTLDGTLNVTGGAGFGPGVYRLIDYTGALTDNTIVFGTTPVAAGLLSVQTSVAHQVNFVFNAGASNFWSGGSGTWSASSASTAWTDSGGFVASAWTPQFAIFQNAAGTVTVDTTAGAVVFAGAQFAVNGYTVAGGTLTNNTAAAPFRVGDGTAAGTAMTATISAAIAGTGGLDKTDRGTLVLSGANTYTGATTVTGGSLIVNGNQSAATGATTVRTGAALTGSGTLGGAVTIENGGTLAGRSGATLTTGSLTLNPASIVNVTLGAPSTTTLFQVNGSLTLDGTLNLTSAPSFGPGLYRLFNYTGALTDNGLDFGTTAGIGVNSFSLLTSTANQVSLLYRDLVTPLPIWNGGSGTWTADPAGTGFANSSGSVSGGWRPGLAIFQGTPGTVTVDTTAGAVVVTGIQFASGGYTIAGGALTNNTAAAPFRVGDGTAAGSAMTATISAPIAGTGGIDKTDLGTLILSGTNTYTGGTTVSGGVLQVTNAASLGATTGGLTLNGGTLRAGAAFTSARAVTLGATGGTFDTGANTLALSGVIAGTGPLTKTGAGQLTLSGTNTYTGATTISAGTLMLDNSSVSATTIAAAGTLAGNGTVRGNLVNNGRLSPGASPGTIAVSGNFTQGSTGTLVEEIASGTSFDKLTVTGTATLGGTLAVTGLNGFVPTVGQSFAIITATGGVSGTFATVTSPWDNLSAMLRFQTNYTANAVTLTLAQRAFASLLGTPNQIAVGKAVDGAIASSSIPALRTALNAIPTDAGVLAALSQLSPQRYERWFEQSVYSTGATVRSVENRLADTANKPETGLWMELARRETQWDAAGESAQSKGTANGLVVGGDTDVTSSFKLGLLLGYTDEDLTLDTAGSTTKTQRLSGALYARIDANKCFVEMAGGLGRGSLTSCRTIAVPGYAQAAGGETDSYDAFFNLRVSRPLPIEAASVTPYAAVQFTTWQANGFDETGAAQANLSLDSLSGRSTSGRFGVTLARAVSSESGSRLRPRLDIAWRKEFQDETREITGTLGNSAFAVQSRRAPDSGFVASIGLDAKVGESLSAYARLAGEWSTAADQAFEAQVGLAYRF
jgi:fibronectin-binding autotransporter adhesin